MHKPYKINFSDDKTKFYVTTESKNGKIVDDTQLFPRKQSCRKNIATKLRLAGSPFKGKEINNLIEDRTLAK